MTASVTPLASFQCVSNHSWSCATSRARRRRTFADFTVKMVYPARVGERN